MSSMLIIYLKSALLIVNFWIISKLAKQTKSIPKYAYTIYVFLLLKTGKKSNPGIRAKTVI